MCPAIVSGIVTVNYWPFYLPVPEVFAKVDLALSELLLVSRVFNEET